MVIWVTKASGVELAGDWAEEIAPATSIHAAAALKKAIISLIIKKPNEIYVWGLLGPGQARKKTR